MTRTFANLKIVLVLFVLVAFAVIAVPTISRMDARHNVVAGWQFDNAENKTNYTTNDCGDGWFLKLRIVYPGGSNLCTLRSITSQKLDQLIDQQLRDWNIAPEDASNEEFTQARDAVLKRLTDEVIYRGK